LTKDIWLIEPGPILQDVEYNGGFTISALEGLVMNFSEKEKIIIKHIDSGEIRDLLNYLEVMVPLKEISHTVIGGEREGAAFFNVHGSSNLELQTNKTTKIVENEDALARELLAFLALCKKLEKVYLLQTLDKATYTLMPPMSLSDVMKKEPNQIANIFVHNSHFAIVPFNPNNPLAELRYANRSESGHVSNGIH